jgi:hypothetical protein
LARQLKADKFLYRASACFKQMQKFIARIIILIIITAIICIKPVSAATPTQVIRVSPAIVDIELLPGNLTTYAVKVDNLTASPLPLTAAVEGFDASDEEGGYVFNNSNVQSPLSAWVTIDKPDMIIPANSAETVNLTVAIPKTVSLGGYYAVLFLTPVNQSAIRTQIVTPRVGVLLLANIGVQDPNAPATAKIKILDFAFTKPVFDRENVSWILRAQNISLNFLTAKPILTLQPLIGKPIMINMAEKIILPGKIRRWNEIRQSSLIPYGIYNAGLMLSVGGGRQISQSSYLIVLPVRTIGLSLLLFIMIGYLFLKRKNLKKTLKILFNLK